MPRRIASEREHAKRTIEEGSTIPNASLSETCPGLEETAIGAMPPRQRHAIHFINASPGNAQSDRQIGLAEKHFFADEAIGRE
jgi:hypothetical protein